MTTNSESIERSLRILPFNGEQEKWRMWSRQFLACAHKKGYKKVLLGIETPPAESDATTDYD